MALKAISQETLKTDFGVNNRPILALKVSIEASSLIVCIKMTGF